MLKKLIAMTIVTTMLLSSFCIIARAEYGYDYQDTICGASREKTYTTLANHRAYMQGTSTSKMENNAAQNAYFLYNSNGVTSKSMRFNNQTSGDIMKFKDYMFDLNTVDYAGQWFYSVGYQNFGNLRLTNEKFKSDTTKWTTADTITFNYKIRYDDSFILTLFTATTHSALHQRNINLFRITAEGDLYTGPKGTTTDYVCTLNRGTVYDIGVVLKFIPTSTSGTYNVIKSIYVDNDFKYAIQVSDAQKCDLKFWDAEIDVYPWTVATTAGADASAVGTTYCGSLTLTESLKSTVYKYTLIPTHFMLSDFSVTAGDKYATKQTSLTNESTDFYISSNTRNNTNYVTVAAQTAADDATGTGTIVLATYNTSGALESIKTSPITLTKGAITEQDIDISTANANETKLFIINSTSAMTPLAASTALN